MDRVKLAQKRVENHWTKEICMLNLSIHSLFSISEILQSQMDDRWLYAHHVSPFCGECRCAKKNKKTLHGYSILYIKKVQQQCKELWIKVCIILLTCSKALAIYVTRMAAKVPSFMALLKTSEEHGGHSKHTA